MTTQHATSSRCISHHCCCTLQLGTHFKYFGGGQHTRVSKMMIKRVAFVLVASLCAASVYAQPQRGGGSTENKNPSCVGDLAADCAKIWACSPNMMPSFDTARIWNQGNLGRQAIDCLDCSMTLYDTLDVTYATGDWPTYCQQACGDHTAPPFTSHVNEISQYCPNNALSLAPGAEALAFAAPFPELIAPVSEVMVVPPVAELPTTTTGVQPAQPAPTTTGTGPTTGMGPTGTAAGGTP